MELQKEVPHFYLHISGIGKMRQIPLKLRYGPYASVEEAQAQYRQLTLEPGYEYTVRISPGSK